MIDIEKSDNELAHDTIDRFYGMLNKKGIIICPKFYDWS